MDSVENTGSTSLTLVTGCRWLPVVVVREWCEASRISRSYNELVNTTIALNPLTVATWNLLGDQFERASRLNLAASQIGDIDILAIQEAVKISGTSASTAVQLASLSDMRVASLVDSGMANTISGDEQATGILTRLEVVEANIEIAVPSLDSKNQVGEHGKYAGALLRTKTGRHVFAVSVHFPWGGESEYRRLVHAEAVNDTITALLKHFPEDTITVLLGDFNTTQSADSLRYLRGDSGAPHHSSFWVDAWSEVGSGPGFTNDPKSGNTNLVRTATSNGIPIPAMLPSRRIDYVLIRGWVFGKPGSPLSATLFGLETDMNGLHASDHYGVKVTLWDPPLGFPSQG